MAEIAGSEFITVYHKHLDKFIISTLIIMWCLFFTMVLLIMSFTPFRPGEFSFGLELYYSIFYAMPFYVLPLFLLVFVHVTLYFRLKKSSSATFWLFAGLSLDILLILVYFFAFMLLLGGPFLPFLMPILMILLLVYNLMLLIKLIKEERKVHNNERQNRMQ